MASERIYVASSFEQRDEVSALHRLLRNAGHTITADWTTHREITSLESIVEREKLKQQYAIEDTNGVKTATIYVLLLGNRKSTGAHIELGVALGSNINRVCIIGEPDTSQLFYSHPAITIYPNIRTFLDSL